MSGYLRDSQLRRQLEEKAREATRTKQTAEDALKEAQAVIESARKIEAPVVEAEKALAEASAAMGAKDYRRAADKAAEAVERGMRIYRDRVSAILESSAGLLDLAKGVGVAVADSETVLAKARDALAADKLDEAVDLAKKSWKRSEKGLSEHLSSSFSKVQSLLLSAKNLGKDVAHVEDLLSRARSAMEGNNFQSALDFTREGLETITEELTSALEKELEEAEEVLRTAEELGADPTKARTFLDRAKADVADLDFEKANNSVRQSKAESEKALQRSLEGKIADFSKYVAEARALGADTALAEGHFAKADHEVKAGHVREAGRLAREGFQALQEAQFRRVVQRIGTSREKFVAAVNLGIDLKDSIAHLNNAREALQKNAFREALDWADKADSGVDAAMGRVRQIQERLKDLHRAFAEAETLGVDTKPARRATERAREAYQTRDFDQVARIIDEAEEELRKSEREQIMRSIEDAEFILTLGEKNATDMSEPSKTLEDAILAVKEGGHPKALGLVSAARGRAEELLQARASDVMTALKNALPHVGDEAPSLKAILNRAEASLGVRDFEGAFKAAEEGRSFVEARTRAEADRLAEALGLTIQLSLDLGAAVSAEEALYQEMNAALGEGRMDEVLGMRERAQSLLTNSSQDLLGLVKARIDQAQGLKLDVDEMSDFYNRARMAIAVRNFTEGLRALKESSDRASRATAMHRNAYNALSGAAAAVAEARKHNVDVNRVVEMLVDAKKALERFDYENSMELAARVRAETEKLTVIYSSAQKILATKERIEFASRLGIDAPHLQDMASEAKEAMKAKDYDSAVRLASKAEEEFSGLIRGKIDAILAELRSQLGPDDGPLFAGIGEEASRAHAAAEAGDLGQAVDLVLRARQTLDKLKRQGEEIDGGLRRVRDIVSDAEAMDLNLPRTQRILAKAERAHQTGQFEEALDLIAQADAEVIAERDQGVAVLMTRFRESIEKAKREGTDTRSAETLYHRAQELFRSKMYRQALATALQSEAEAERVALQQAMASQAVDTAERKLAELGRPAPPVEALVRDARGALAKGDFVKALDGAIHASDALAEFRVLLEEAAEVRLRAQALCGSAREIGADSEKLDGFFQDGERTLAAGDVEEARAAFSQCLQWGVGLLRAHLKEMLDRTHGLVEIAKRLEVDTTSIENRLSSARGRIESEDFSDAFREVREGKDEALQALGNRLHESLLEAADNIAHAKKLGTDARNAEELLRQAQERAERGEFEAALEVVGRAVEQVESVKVVERRFVDLTFKAETTIRNGKKFGIDMRLPERRLAEAMEARKKDLAAALRTAEEAYRLAWDAVEAFAPAMEGGLEVGPATLNEPVEAVLTVENVGKGLAKDVHVRVLGDAEATGLRDLPSVRAHGQETIPFTLRMTAPGSVPLAIQIVSHRVFDDKEYVQEFIAQIEVAEGPQGRSKRLVADLDSRCPICKGAIKKGFKVTRCACGRDFHELCATRVGRCPVCFRSLSVPAE